MARTLLCIAFFAILVPVAAQEGAPPPPPTWPRTFSKAGDTVVLYQPQVDAWKDHSKIRFRMAIAVTREADKKTHYGVVAAEADTLIDEKARTVLMTNMDVAVRFPGLSDADAAPLKATAKDLLPNLNYLDVGLDQVLAYMHGKTEVRTVPDLNLAPPPIYYSDTPAILVIYMGQPSFKPIEGAQLMFAVNTNWVVLMDTTSSQYYLLDGDSWLTAPDPVKGPWTAVSSLPDTIVALPETGNWADVRKHIPGTPATSVPQVIGSTEPAELIVTNGPPQYTPIAGTRLMYVSNPVTPLLIDLKDSQYYYLAAGRWFRSTDVHGPWTAASSDLPAEFAKIPGDSPLGYVLASVPKTQEAEDAALLATVPHKATIDIATAKVDVTYEGQPKFVAIKGTTMTYAVNTGYQVLCVGSTYYCCYQAVWFVASSATGPWRICTTVPAVIYTIPPSCPLYNVTYVQVYSTTPTTVVVGYTAGYSGEYVAATGALMFGAGMLTGALLASDDCHWYGCPPCYYSYGCCAHYSYGYGCYYRGGSAYYGPHGGCGWGAAYNPATGTYARGGYAYGPGGAHWGAQAYNPWTNTYAAHAGGSSGFQSWGSSYVQQGNKWAEGAHTSGPRGSAGWAENSSGQWAAGAHAGNTTIANSSNGAYAAHDGNVYKNTGDGWQKYSGNGNWSDTSWNKSTASANAARSDASSWGNSFKSNWGDSSWKSGWENGGGSGGGSWGQHDTEQGLNRDSWARDQGNSNSFSSWGDRSSGSGWGSRSSGGGWGSGGGGWGHRFGGGGGGFGGGGFGGRFGGGGGFGGGRFGRR